MKKIFSSKSHREVYEGIVDFYENPESVRCVLNQYGKGLIHSGCDDFIEERRQEFHKSNGKFLKECDLAHELEFLCSQVIFDRSGKRPSLDVYDGTYIG